MIGADGAASPQVDAHCEDLFQSFGTSFSYDPVQVRAYAEFLAKLPEKIDRIYEHYLADVARYGDRLSSRDIEDLGDIWTHSRETQTDVIYHALKNRHYPMTKSRLGAFLERAFTWDVSPFIGQRTFLRFDQNAWSPVRCSEFEVAGVLNAANAVLATELPFVRFVVEPRFDSGMNLDTYSYVANVPQCAQLYRDSFGKPMTESLEDLFWRQTDGSILKYMFPFMGEGFRIPHVASREFWWAQQESRVHVLGDREHEYKVIDSMFFRLPLDTPNINRTALDEWRICAKDALNSAHAEVYDVVSQIQFDATLVGRFRGFLRYFFGENKDL